MCKILEFPKAVSLFMNINAVHNEKKLIVCKFGRAGGGAGAGGGGTGGVAGAGGGAGSGTGGRGQVQEEQEAACYYCREVWEA